MDGEPREMEYNNLLEVRILDTSVTRDRGIRFLVADNFNIYITAQPHEHIFETFGVDPKAALLEGYIRFDSAGAIDDVWFKSPNSQVDHNLPKDQLEKLQEAVEEKIRAEV